MAGHAPVRSAAVSASVGLSVTISGLSRLFGDDIGAVVDVARQADELGVEQLVFPDHVAIGPRLDRYPYSARFPYPPSEPWLEPLTALAAIAGATTRIRLGTGVLIAPLRPVLLLAKTVATLDVLSRGRVDLGIGTGWQREEFVEPGMGFVGRTQRMDNAIAACRALWGSEPPVTFESETISFSEIWSEPRPVQTRIPVWYGGALTDPMVGRIATAATNGGHCIGRSQVSNWLLASRLARSMGIRTITTEDGSSPLFRCSRSRAGILART